MKRNILIYIIAVMLFCAVPLTAEEDEKISLPDVTTEITSNTLKVESDVIPDFADVVEIPVKSSDVIPVLPDIQTQEQIEIDLDDNSKSEKSIYAEGKIGGGFPNLFAGDFSLYRINGNSPFNLTFGHDSASGYAGNSLINGFFERKTFMSLEKQFYTKFLDMDFGGLYKNTGDGFQNKVEGISDINKNVIVGYGNMLFKLPHEITAGINLNFDFYNRYEDIINTGAVTYQKIDWLNPGLMFDISPKIFGSIDISRFKIDVSGTYWYNKDFSNSYKVIKSTSDGKPAENKEINSSHRAEFNVGLNWKYNDLTLYGDISAVIGTQMNVLGNNFILPFRAGINYAFPIYFSNRKPDIVIEGGLSSVRNSIMELETAYKFTGVNTVPTETSDWYGKLVLSIPLKESFTGSAMIEYKQTAFGNGMWKPMYTKEYLVNGLYSYVQTERMQFTTNFDLTYKYKIFSASLGWYSSWLDVPVLEASQTIKLLFSFHSLNSKIGVNFYGDLLFGDVSVTGLPVFGLEGYVHITSALSVVVAVDDAIHLFTNNIRIYTGQYASKGGSASLMVKFFF